MSPLPALEPPNKRPDRNGSFRYVLNLQETSQATSLQPAQAATYGAAALGAAGLPPRMQPFENGRHGSRDQVIDNADATVTSEAKLMLGRLESLHWTRQRPQ